MCAQGYGLWDCYLTSPKHSLSLSLFLSLIAFFSLEIFTLVDLRDEDSGLGWWWDPWLVICRIEPTLALMRQGWYAELRSCQLEGFPISIIQPRFQNCEACLKFFFPKPQIPIWDDTYRYCISIRSFCFFRSRSRQTRVIALMAFEWWQSIPVVHQGSLIFIRMRKRENWKWNQGNGAISNETQLWHSPIQLFNEEKIHEKVREPFVFNNERYSKRWPWIKKSKPLLICFAEDFH